MKFQLRLIVLVLFVFFVSIWFALKPIQKSVELHCSDNESCLDEIGRSLKDKGAKSHASEQIIGILFNESDEKLRDEGYNHYAFNDLISTRIGSHRSIPDTRHGTYDLSY